MILVAAAVLLVCVGATLMTQAQDKPIPTARYEYTMMKWDGPDKVQLFYPNKFEYFRVFEQGNKLPKNAHDEEYCVALVINKLAKDGWEPIQLHATRVLFRRALGAQ